MKAAFAKKHISLGDLSEIKKLLRNSQLNTVCESALCPNIGECFSRNTATFLIMGNVCTRNCAFCAVSKGAAKPLDLSEPVRVARAVSVLGLKYAVITSVTRDDIPDNGASHFYNTVIEIKKACPDTKVEILTPDFNGDLESENIVFSSMPFVFNHNLETVPRLYKMVRPMADYQRSLLLISHAKDYGLVTKSGLMLGMGEKKEEVVSVMKDLVSSGCDVLTLGQYLAPSGKHYPVNEYITLNTFEELKNAALKMGFKKCFSAPYVRSSYYAEEILN